jgi:hypothetical protein
MASNFRLRSTWFSVPVLLINLLPAFGFRADPPIRNDSGTSALRLGLGWGGIWAHNPPVKHLARSHPLQLMAEWSREKPSAGLLRWYGPTRVVLCLHYFDYRSSVLGRSLAAVYALEPGLGRGWIFRFGTGLVVNFKPFNLNSNPANLMLGGPVSSVMHAMVARNMGAVQLGLGLTHFSNGAFDLPNSGINIFFLRAAYAFSLPGKQPPDQPESVKLEFPSREVSVAFSLVERKPGENRKYGVFQIQGRLYRRPGRRWDLGAGIDGGFNAAADEDIRQDTRIRGSGWWTGIPLSWRLQISRSTVLIAEFGAYLYRGRPGSEPVYQRYGIRHLLSPHLTAGFLLKSHKARAECLEWQLGWAF